MFNKEKELVKILTPMVEQVNVVLGNKLLEAFQAGYKLGKEDRIKEMRKD